MLYKITSTLFKTNKYNKYLYLIKKVKLRKIKDQKHLIEFKVDKTKISQKLFKEVRHQQDRKTIKIEDIQLIKQIMQFQANFIKTKEILFKCLTRMLNNL